MKTKFLTFLTLFTFISGQSQITISYYDMPIPTSVFMYNNTGDLDAEDFTLTGANYNWDYSAATSSGNDTLSVVTVASTPFAYQYYFNNQFQFPDHKSDYAIEGQDVDAFGQVTITDRFNYFKVNGNSLEITGFGANVNGAPASVKYDTIDQQYPFLMSHNMPIHNSVGYYLLTVPSFGTYGQWIRREVEVDGWGSLETPTQSYPDVLRVKTTLEQRDTVYVDQFSFGQTFDRPTEVHYEWFTNTDNAPVMSVTEQGGQISNVKYLAPIASSVSEIKNNVSIVSLEDGVFKILVTQKIEQISIIDMNGKQIINESSQKAIVNIKNQAKGVYIIQILTEDKNIVTQKIIR
jgi:hypothetical protein